MLLLIVLLLLIPILSQNVWKIFILVVYRLDDVTTLLLLLIILLLLLFPIQLQKVEQVFILVISFSWSCSFFWSCSYCCQSCSELFQLKKKKLYGKIFINRMLELPVFFIPLTNFCFIIFVVFLIISDNKFYYFWSNFCNQL